MAAAPSRIHHSKSAPVEFSDAGSRREDAGEVATSKLDEVAVSEVTLVGSEAEKVGLLSLWW